MPRSSSHIGPRFIWAAANGGVTNGGLRGVWPPFPKIARNRPFSPFFCLFRPFPEDMKSTWEIQKTEEKGLFPQISSDLLKPPSLKPPFAALQLWGSALTFGVFSGCFPRTPPPHKTPLKTFFCYFVPGEPGDSCKCKTLGAPSPRSSRR